MVRKQFHPRLDRGFPNCPAVPFSRELGRLTGQKRSWGTTRYASALSLQARGSCLGPKRTAKATTVAANRAILPER
jgi:hypothetical protein